MKIFKPAVSVAMIVLFGFVAVQLVLAAFSNSKRRLGSNTEFNGATIAGGMTWGSSIVDGSVKIKPSTSPPTCNSGAEGTMYTNTTDHKVYLCNGTSWSSL